MADSTDTDTLPQTREEAFMAWSALNNRALLAERDVADLRARLAAAESVLRPFAAAAESWTDTWLDETPLRIGLAARAPQFTLADVRRAASLMWGTAPMPSDVFDDTDLVQVDLNALMAAADEYRRWDVVHDTALRRAVQTYLRNADLTPAHIVEIREAGRRSGIVEGLRIAEAMGTLTEEDIGQQVSALAQEPPDV